MSCLSQGSCVCTEYARTLIRVKARQIVRHPGFNRSETGDVENDLFLQLLKQARRFDPTRSSLNTFTARVVDSAVAMLVRDRRREKRSPGTGVAIESLELMIDQTGGPPTPLGATLSQADADRRIGGDSISNTELFELANDVATLVDALPPVLQAVCRVRMNRNRSEAESELGLSRRSYDAAIELIREHFSRGGFGKS